MFRAIKPLFFCLHPVRVILRIFFRLLYHQFAFAYDLVAATVSFGHWKDWTQEVIPFIEGIRTLEIGHGPGYLHRVLLSRSLVAVAMDESAPMGRIAKRKLTTQNVQNPNHSLSEPIAYSGYAQTNLTRGIAQHLPFRDESFTTVIATFPTEYFADTQTLSEVKRCLSDGGRFIVLPVAMPKNRFLSWLFQVTHQAPSDALKVIQEKLEEPFVKSDFDVETHVLDRESGTLIVIVAKKKER